MAEVLYASSFFEEIGKVEKKRVRDNILDATELLAVMPEMGSTNLPRLIVEKYGPDVRKLVVPPFLVLYKLLPADRVLVLGVMHNRAAY